MGKANREDLSLTRKYMAMALVMLMEEKPFDDISITEITNKAGLSRMAYYRNYNSKEDIFVKYLLDVGGDLAENLAGHRYTSLHDLIVQVGLFLQSNYTVALAAVKAGQSDRLMMELTKKIFSAFPEISVNAENEYITSFYLGAVLGVFGKWFEREMTESVYEIADMICGLIDSETEKRFLSAGNQGV